MNGLLARATSTWNRDRMGAVKRRTPAPVTSAPPAPDDTKPKRKRGLPAPPSGWGTDAEASRTSIMAAKMLKQLPGGDTS